MQLLSWFFSYNHDFDEDQYKVDWWERKKVLSMVLKREIDKLEMEVRVMLTTECNCKISTIRARLKQKDILKWVTLYKGVKFVSKLCNCIHETVVNLLLLWFTEKKFAGYTVSETVICKKSRIICTYFLEMALASSALDCWQN